MKKIWILILPILIFAGCNQKYTPKPRQFFRIDFPEKTYHQLQPGFPYQFDIPDYSRIVSDDDNPDQPNWINISVPANKAEIHISYYNLSESKNSNRVLLNKFMEDSRTLAYKHSQKADAISEQVFMNPSENVYGLIYKIEGNAASPMQFFLTDSTNHFLRGALYIRDIPNIDSLKPVIDFLETDIVRLIETTTWN
ncbi:MAG: gliding motility lipoprotein GldD [Draconibacterium sp.]|nr:gliding motility lipoprotein GldD [Draconibacterium sp.]